MIVKFPYNASRRIFARRRRRSKNGTPEERAAKRSAATPNSATVIQFPRTPKQKQRHSAVCDVYQSGLELVAKRKPRRGKLIKERDYARLEFEPWSKETMVTCSAHNMNYLGVSCRLACGIVMQTKAQLINMHKEIDHDTVDELMGILADTGERLKFFANMVESAYLRVLASACAHKAAGGRFRQADPLNGEVAPEF